MKKRILLPPINWLQDRANEIMLESDERAVEEGLRAILRYYEPLNYTLGYGAPLWRGRKCDTDKGFRSLSEVHYPPAESAGSGRVNDDGSPLLYVSFTQLTALTEIRAEPGDVVHVVGYRTRKDKPIRCFTLGEFANVHLRGQGHLPSEVSERINRILLKMDFEAGLSFVFLDAFLASVMADQKMESMNYIHSRTLARLLFEKYPDISGVHYPSVARGGAMNLAVKPNVADGALDFMGTSVLDIDEKFDFGLYRFSVMRCATEFDTDRTIKWS